MKVFSKNNTSFQDKVVLISGASSGIGKGLALFFARQGAKVIINFKDSKVAACQILDQIESFSGEGLLIQADITQRNEVKKMVRQGLKKFKQLNVLINNAGGVLQPANWLKVSQLDFNKTLELNLSGCFNCIREVAPHMLKAGTGKIVNISSIAGFMGGAQAPAYTAAKAGVINLTKAFAKELAPDINVNCIAPGWINTSWHKSKKKDFFEMIQRETPLKRIGEVEDVVNAAAFLSSEQANYITGQTLIVDGGTSLS